MNLLLSFATSLDCSLIGPTTHCSLHFLQIRPGPGSWFFLLLYHLWCRITLGPSSNRMTQYSVDLLRQHLLAVSRCGPRPRSMGTNKMIHFFGLNCENKTKGTKVLGNRTTNFGSRERISSSSFPRMSSKGCHHALVRIFFR